MFDVRESLQSGLSDADERLRSAQRALAHANASPGSHLTESAMAQTARAALFTEALLGATHARLAEIKAVTK